jgi:hypothetical protein
MARHVGGLFIAMSRPCVSGVASHTGQSWALTSLPLDGGAKLFSNHKDRSCFDDELEENSRHGALAAFLRLAAAHAESVCKGTVAFNDCLGRSL